MKGLGWPNSMGLGWGDSWQHCWQQAKSSWVGWFSIKPLLSWLLIAVLSLSGLLVGGCQSGRDRTGDTAQDIVRITLWHGINPPSNRDVFQRLVDRFNQTHPTIAVEALYVGQPDQQLPKILTATVGDVPPDLLWYVPSITGQLVELGAIRPLEEWFEQLPTKADLDPALLGTMALNDHLWSVPMATNNAAIFYRPSLFRAAGIEQPPQTWEGLRRDARTLTQDRNGDGRVDQHGILLSLGTGEWTVFVWLPFIFSAGGELLQAGQPQLVDPGIATALQFGADLVADGSAVLSAPERGYELDDFIAGRVAMQVTGPWTFDQLQQSGIDYAVFPIPPLKAPAAVVGGENLFAFRTTPEREAAALEFLAYVLDEEFQTDWALGTGYLPINLRSRDSSAYQAFVAEHPPLKIFLEQMEWARSRPIVPGYSRLSQNLGRAIESVLLGQRAPEQALEEAQARLNLMLDKR